MKKRYFIVSITILSLLCFTKFTSNAQNILWQTGFPKMQTNLVSFDTAYLEVYFQASAASGSNVSVTIVPKTSGLSIISSVPVALNGNDISYSTSLSGSTAYNLGVLSASDYVHFKIPVKSSACNTDPGSIEIKLEGGSIPDNAKIKTVTVNYTRPIINILAPGTSDYTFKGEAKTYKVPVSASQGKIFSAYVTVRMDSRLGYATNFKFNNQPVTPAKTKFLGTGTAVTSSDSLWTVSLTPEILAATTGGVIKEGEVPDTLYFDAVTKTGCGSKTGYVNAWGPTGTNQTTACFTLGTDRPFTLQMEGATGRPTFRRGNWKRMYNTSLLTYTSLNLHASFTNYTSPAPTTLDYSLADNVPSYYHAMALNNTGTAVGSITYILEDARPGNEYVSGTSYIDTANIYYCITDGYNGGGNVLYGGTKKMGADHWVYLNEWAKLKAIRRKLKSEYQEKIIRFVFSIPERIPNGGSCVYFVGMKEGIFYDDTTSVNKHSIVIQESGAITANAYNWYGSYRRIAAGPRTIDTCGKEWNDQHDGYQDSYYTLPWIREQQLDIQFTPGSTKEFTIPVMYNGNIMNQTFGLECDVVIQLPDWIEIDMSKPKPVSWYRSEDPAKIWPYTSITNKGNGKYVIHYKSDNSATSGTQDMTGSFTVYYTTTNVASGYTDNQDYMIDYSIDLFTSGDSTETTEHPKLPKIGRAGQLARLIVKHEGIELYDFHLHRITRGYTDDDNDNIPDNANLAPDNKINHYNYIASDSGYMTWKARLMGDYANAAFIVSSPTIPLNSNINANAFGNKITVKIKRASNSQTETLAASEIAYSLFTSTTPENGVNMQYRKIGIKILKTLNTSDSIEVVLPFTATGSDATGQMTATAFVTNQSNNFNVFTETNKTGVDIIPTPSLVRTRYSGYNSNTDYNYCASRPNNTINGVYALNLVNTTTVPNNDIRIGFSGNNITDGSYRFNSAQAWTLPYQHAGSSFFQYEARPSIVMDSLSITLPKGYRFIGDSINYAYRIYSATSGNYKDYIASATGYPNTSFTLPTEYAAHPWIASGDNYHLESDNVSRTLMSINLKKYFETPAAGSSLATGKARNPIERVLFEPKPYYRATKGAPLSDYAYVTFFYKRIPNNDATPYMSVTRVPLSYTGPCNKITSSVSELTINTGRVTLPSVSLGNPSSVDNSQNWIYLKGNVRNVKIKINNTVVDGQGYQQRYVKVSDLILAGNNAPFFDIEFQYDGTGGICEDTLTVIAISGFNTNWNPTSGAALNGNPAIDYPWNDQDINYTGDYFDCLLKVITPTINGTLTLTNNDATTPDNMVAHGKTQTLKAMLAAEGSTGSDGALKGKMTVTVPKGQKYVSNSARISYPSGASPESVPSAVESALVSAVGSSTNSANERAFVFDFEQFTDTMPSLIDGIGPDANRQAVLTMEFTPDCNTPTDGLIYKALLNGKSACGVTAVHDGTVISSAPKYPKSGGGYNFELTSAVFENGITAVGPIDTIIKVTISLTKKGQGAVTQNDSLQIIMGAAFSIHSITGTVDGSNLSDETKSYSNNETNGIRTVTMNFPYTQINNAGANNGENKSLTYDIELAFSYSDFIANPTYNAINQPFALHIISEQKFDNSCGGSTLSVLGSFDTTLVAVDFYPYPAVLCRERPHPVEIRNYNDFLFLCDWYREIPTGYLSPGKHPDDYIVPNNNAEDDTLYVKIFDPHDLSKVNGIIRYPYKKYNWFEAHVGPDTACLGVEVTLLDWSTLNGVRQEANSPVWEVVDGTYTTGTLPTHTFSTAGWHIVEFYANYNYTSPNDPYPNGSPCHSYVKDSIFIRPLPQITTCPAPIDIMLRGGQCDTVVLIGTPVSTNDPAVKYTNDASSPYTFGRGITKIEWFVKDDYCPDFNADSCLQIVAVNMPPCGYNDEFYYSDGSTTYTNDGATVTDHEGNSYPTHRYCCDCWTISNLRSTQYADGTDVEYHKYRSNMHPNENRNGLEYGLLYDYAAATRNNSSAQGICPDGWHLPTVTNFNCLLNYTSLDLKTAFPGPNFWLGESVSNSASFGAVPSGYYDGYTGQSFRMLGDSWFWIYDVTSTGPMRLSCHLFFGCPEVSGSKINERWGVNVRCVRD